MYRIYSCILMNIIILQACDNNNKNTSPLKPPQTPPLMPVAKPPVTPPMTLELVLTNINDSLLDWQKNQAKFKQEIKDLEKVLRPFSIEDVLSAKRVVNETLLLRLANYNQKINLDEIKKNIPFALDIIILIKSLVDFAQIPAHLQKDIKEIREKLLVDPAIKIAYFRLLAEKSDPKEILEIYAKKSDFDLKIYDISLYDSPNNYQTKSINWKIKSQEGDMDLTQYPGLNQQMTLQDPTNYCGYYAIFNASALNKPASLQFGDREAFKKFFKTSLETIKEARIDSNSTDTTEDDLLRLSHLDHLELFDLTATSGVSIQNLDFTSEFMTRGLDHDDDAIVIPNIIRQFLKTHDKKDDVETQVFVGNTLADGSHWFAFSLEKKQGVLVVKLVDSLGKNWQSKFEEWFPAR